MLHGLAFPSIFVDLIMECVSTVSYSINVNGSLHGLFQRQEGAAPKRLVFPILCMEYLSRSLRLVTKDSDFNFHPKCGSLKIVHLIFTDDFMLFSRGTLYLCTF